MKGNKDKAEFQTGSRLKKADGSYQKFGKFYFWLIFLLVVKGVPVITEEGVLTHWYGICTPVKDDH
jgi:hypothetical protein